MPICPYPLPIAETMLPELVIENIAGERAPYPHGHSPQTARLPGTSLSHEQKIPEKTPWIPMIRMLVSHPIFSQPP
jgi:hypothetical protein